MCRVCWGIERLGIVVYIPDMNSTIFVTRCELVCVEWVARDVVHFFLGQIKLVDWLLASAVPHEDFRVEGA